MSSYSSNHNVPLRRNQHSSYQNPRPKSLNLTSSGRPLLNALALDRHRIPTSSSSYNFANPYLSSQYSSLSGRNPYDSSSRNPYDSSSGYARLSDMSSSYTAPSSRYTNPYSSSSIMGKKTTATPSSSSKYRSSNSSSSNAPSVAARLYAYRQQVQQNKPIASRSSSVSSDRSEGYASDRSGRSSRLSSVSSSGGLEAEDSAAGTQDDASTENGDLDYKKLYEESRVENERLRLRLRRVEDELRDNKSEKQSGAKSSMSEAEKRERRAMERKLSEMEEELKQFQKLKAENEKLKAENRALTRVVSKLSQTAGNLAAK